MPGRTKRKQAETPEALLGSAGTAEDFVDPSSTSSTPSSSSTSTPAAPARAKKLSRKTSSREVINLHLESSNQLLENRAFQAKVVAENTRTKKSIKEQAVEKNLKRDGLTAEKFFTTGYSTCPPENLNARHVDEGAGGTPNSSYFRRQGLQTFQNVLFTLLNEDIWGIYFHSWNKSLELQRVTAPGYAAITWKEFWFMIGSYLVAGARGLSTLDSLYAHMNHVHVESGTKPACTKSRFHRLHSKFPQDAKPQELTELLTRAFRDAFTPSGLCVIDETLWFGSHQAKNIREREVVALARKPAGMGLLGYMLCCRAKHSSLPYVFDFVPDGWYRHVSPGGACKELVARFLQENRELGRHLFVDSAFSTAELQEFLLLIGGVQSGDGLPLIDVTMSAKAGWSSSVWDAMQLGLEVNHYRLATRVHPVTKRTETVLCFAVLNCGKVHYINRYSTAYAHGAVLAPRLPGLHSPPAEATAFSEADARIMLGLSQPALHHLALRQTQSPAGSVAELVTQITGIDIVRLDASRSQDTLADFLGQPDVSDESLEGRIFIDSLSKKAFTKAALNNLNLATLQHLCHGHLKSSGAKNKAQLIRWMLRCDGCSMLISTDQAERDLAKLKAFDQSFAPSYSQLRDDLHKKEDNMHPLAGSYKKNFNLIDRFDRSLAEICVTIKFGQIFQRYHLSLLFMSIVNAWVLFIENRCTRTHPVGKVRKEYPLKKLLEELGLKTASESFTPAFAGASARGSEKP